MAKQSAVSKAPYTPADVMEYLDKHGGRIAIWHNCPAAWFGKVLQAAVTSGRVHILPDGGLSLDAPSPVINTMEEGSNGSTNR